MVTVSSMILRIVFWKDIFSQARRWLLKCASQRAAKKDFVILVFNGTSNAIAGMNQIMDLSGPG